MYVCIYIYIYTCICTVFTNLLSTSIHGYQEKRKKRRFLRIYTWGFFLVFVINKILKVVFWFILLLFHIYIYIYILFIFYFFFCYVNFKLSRFLVNIKMVFSPLSLVGAKLPWWSFEVKINRIQTRDLS